MRAPRRQILLLIAVLAVTTQTQAREFRLGLITPPGHVWSTSAVAFGKALNEASNGRHSVTVYPSQQLGNEAQILQQLQTGAVDMAFLTVAEVSNRVPDFGAFYAPYLVRDISGAAALLRSEEAFSLLDQLPRRIGVFGVGYGMAGMRQILTRDQTTALIDLRGQKLRITPFAPIRDFYQLIGAAPTPMPLGSVYDALANGQVDAIDMDLELIVKLRYHELADTALLSNHMMFPMVGLVSARVWVRLEEEEQVLIQKLMHAELDAIIDFYAKGEQGFEKSLRETKVNVVEVDREFFGTVVEDWDAMWQERAPALNLLRGLSEGQAD